MIDPKLLLSVASTGPDAAEAIGQMMDALAVAFRGAGQRAIAAPAEVVYTLPPQVGPDRELLDDDDIEMADTETADTEADADAETGADEEVTACPENVADDDLTEHHANLIETIETVDGPVSKNSLIVQAGYLWGSPTRAMVDLLIRGGWIVRTDGDKLVRGKREMRTQRDPPSQ